MKRRLDLNGPSTRILATIGLFIAAIPAALNFASPLLQGVPAAMVHSLILASLAVGAVLLALFLLLVAIEQAQDALFDRAHRRNRHKRIPLADGRYECQYCGNRQVSVCDRRCSVCGRRLV